MKKSKIGLPAMTEAIENIEQAARAGVVSVQELTARINEANAIEKARLKATRGRIGRNEDCPCGSGRKYKKCHGRDAYQNRKR